jgi:hypothetical protein
MTLAAALIAGAAAVVLPAAPAVAQLEPEFAHPALGPWSGTVGPAASASATTVDDVTVTVSVSGDYLEIHQTRGLNEAPFGAPTEDMFRPRVPIDHGWLGLAVLDGGCGDASPCRRGRLTIEFSPPVLDPVLHLAGLGSLIGLAPIGGDGYVDDDGYPGGDGYGGYTGGLLESPLPGAVNLDLVGTLVRTATPLAPAGCAEGAGCGSVPIVGIISEVAFDVSLPNVFTGTPDGVSLLVSAPQLDLPEQQQPAQEQPAQQPGPAQPNPAQPALSSDTNTHSSHLPDTGVPIPALVGLGAAAVLVGSVLVGGVHAHTRWRRRQAARHH